MDGRLSAVVEWLHQAAVEPLADEAVPGTTLSQRTALAALGALAATAFDERLSPAAWPPSVRRWAASDADVPSPIAKAFAEEVSGPAGSEFLARLYGSCVAPVNRRQLGTFFTPQRFVDEMLKCWEEISGPPTAIVDIGAGVGAFTLPAAKLWPDASLFGVDINPVTLGLLGTLALAQAVPLRSHGSTEGGLRLVSEDFIAWSRKYHELPGPRLILGNPPYTRLQLLPSEVREQLAAALPGKVGSRASLATWMLAQSLEVLEPTDGLALLLPAHWLEADYAAGVRARLAAMTDRRIDLSLLGADVFPDARVDAVSLLVTPVHDSPQHLTVTENGSAVVLERSPEAPVTLRRDRTRSTSADGQPLSTLAITRRGIATGANPFFLLSENDRNDADLPEKFVVPLIRRLHGRGERETPETLAALEDDVQRWVLVVDDADRRDSAALRSYVALGEELALHQRLLCTRREHWFDLHHDVIKPDVVIGPTTRTHFAVVVTTGEVAIANNLYGITWRPEVEERIRSAVIKWMRSDQGQDRLKAVSRHQAHGLWKLEPGELKNLLIPTAVLER